MRQYKTHGYNAHPRLPPHAKTNLQYISCLFFYVASVVTFRYGDYVAKLGNDIIINYSDFSDIIYFGVSIII